MEGSIMPMSVFTEADGWLYIAELGFVRPSCNGETMSDGIYNMANVVM